jgi:hypothetical protein
MALFTPRHNAIVSYHLGLSITTRVGLHVWVSSVQKSLLALCRFSHTQHVSSSPYPAIAPIPIQVDRSPQAIIPQPQEANYSAEKLEQVFLV